MDLVLPNPTFGRTRSASPTSFCCPDVRGGKGVNLNPVVNLAAKRHKRHKNTGRGGNQDIRGRLTLRVEETKRSSSEIRLCFCGFCASLRPFQLLFLGSTRSVAGGAAGQKVIPDFLRVEAPLSCWLLADGGQNLEVKAGAMKTDVEFLEEVDLPQQERDRVAPGPGEDESHPRKAGDLRIRDQGAGFMGRKIAGERHPGGLRLPHGTQAQAEVLRQHVDRRAGIEESMHLDDFAARTAQSQRQQGLKECFPGRRGDGQEGKADGIAHAPEDFRYCVKVAAASAASCGDQTGYPTPGWRPAPSSWASSLVRHWTTRNLSARESWWSIGMISVICMAEEYGRCGL